MKASETNFLKFLQGPKQFLVPIYQRQYSWALQQCRQLWNEVVRAASSDDIKGHFFGSIVYIERGLYHISTIPQLLVIDGQQRITSLTLLLLALGEAIEASSQSHMMTKKKIVNNYLVNNDDEGELYNKLVLTRSDRDTLFSLIAGTKLPDEYSPRVRENCAYFVDAIKNSNISLDRLYQGVSKLIVVDIALDRDHDNPQLIFESLNSTGLDLSQADLIRNYVLMALEPKEQTELYNEYWYPMEQSFGNQSVSNIFDRFMRDYLTVRMGRIPNIQQVYVSFKEYAFEHSELTVQEIVEDIYRFSKHFVKLAFQTEKDKEINHVLQDVNTLRVDVSYPFLLEVYDDYESQRLSKSDFIAILRLVESYVFRRAICGVPTNSLNKTFANLIKEIDKENYMESVNAVFLLKDAYKRLPSNEEFARELVVKDVYNFRNRNYLLRKLENFKRKEIVDIGAYTIEHIMPQNNNLSSEWRRDLGDNWEQVHKTYLHTLGNLTLTRYNSEMSDRPFKEKRDLEGGFSDSPLWLNRELRNLDSWDAAAIEERARSLADRALQVWVYPRLPEHVLSKHRSKGTDGDVVRYSLVDHPELQGEILALFEELSRRICYLDSSVRMEIKKLYIAFKTTTNFVDIVPQKSKLRLTLNLAFNEIQDPKGICRDVSNVGRWGNGDVEVNFSSPDNIDYVMFLINQSFEKRRDEE